MRNELHLRSAAAPLRPCVGISGMSVYVPRPRVALEDWCGWTGNPWDKVKHVVGNAFRVPAPGEDAYTMAANAVLRLVEAYGLDPSRIGFLGLGTESSKDNSAGAVIVRGMLDRELRRRGQPPIARSCEVPELKHACLGGVYALKAALRFVESDDDDRIAVVVCSDIAEYERGSSGEQTQGAGAVAMVVERDPALLEIDVRLAGSASAYRGPDFRKPFGRHFLNGNAGRPGIPNDYPVFSGKYSTFAYLDETAQAVDDMLRRTGRTADEVFEDAAALFFHRPYENMPLQALAFVCVRALAADPARRGELDVVCGHAGVEVTDVLSETFCDPDLFETLLVEGEPMEAFPATRAAAGILRKSDAFRHLVADKLRLGSETVRELGNLYTASLPAWMAAGLEEAANRRVDLSGRTIVAVGYGSGDAAEALPMRVADGWELAARRIGARAALADAVALGREEYEALHDHRTGVPDAPPSGFFISRTGERHDAGFQDLGVEYYEHAG